VLKAVIDANVWIHALLDGSNSLAIIDKLEHEQFQLVFADQLIEELMNVLSRPKFTRIRPERSEQLFALIHEKAVFVELEHISQISRDPKDDVYLACAALAGCDFLVTGDKDLLVLSQHGYTRIVTPAEFLAVLQAVP
jgi:uncharacterized protein